MNKLMKLCGKCEEAFADRFAFCPNCGGELVTYEMNPIMGQAAVPVTDPQAEPVATPAILVEAAAKDEDILEIGKPGLTDSVEPLGDEPAEVTPAEIYAVAAAPVAANGSAGNGSASAMPVGEPVETAVSAAPVYVSEPKHEVPPPPAQMKDGWREVSSKHLVPEDDGTYHLTMVENKTFLNDPRLRATGVFAICAVFAIMVGGMVYDLFTQYVNVPDPNAEELVLSTFPVDPEASVEEIMEQIKTKDANAGGGGGGGGGQDKEDPGKGDPPNMSKIKPDFPPTQHDRSVTDPSLPMFSGVQAPIDRAGALHPGVPNGADRISDGSGNGGVGMNGTGGVGYNGTGGYGANGTNGIGGVPGGGIGNDRGPGTGGDDPPEMPKGPTVSVKMLSQPKPPYTEEARKNQISGTVVLKVTFNSNGTIGSITPVRGLGYGLTEQAIAAARRISFEPAKRGGVPYTSSRSVQYTFTLY
jgi:TonB family protein